MRAERSIRRADICILVIDLTMGVTAQDKRIAGLIQKARKAAIIVLNKWDLVKSETRRKTVGQEINRGDALEDFLSHLRAGVDHVRVDRRKCRSTILHDRKDPTRSAETHWHRSSQPLTAAGV